jgi:hypothetical protein
VKSNAADESGYRPKPLETSGVEVPDELLLLMEELAVNAHEMWASLRIKDGWHHGAKRSDKKKTHPCLVPYGKLSEGEKKYDREMALGTIRVIISLGYEIRRRE